MLEQAKLAVGSLRQQRFQVEDNTIIFTANNDQSVVRQQHLASRLPTLDFRVVATDIDHRAIQRAERGCDHTSSTKELPAEWRSQAFVTSRKNHHLKDEYRASVAFLVQDLRESTPDGLFQLILCRNLDFT